MNPEQKRAIDLGGNPNTILNPEQYQKFAAEKYQEQTEKRNTMIGPYVFKKKDSDLIYKYAVGDWIKGGDHGEFYKIIERLIMNDLPAYSVTIKSRRMTDSGLRYIGDMSAICETDVCPLTDQKDILLCLASDIKAKQYKLLLDVRKFGDDFEALMRTRELVKI